MSYTIKAAIRLLLERNGEPSRKPGRLSSQQLDMLYADQEELLTTTGWSIMVGVLYDEHGEHWYFSAQLVPKGRTSVTGDWDVLIAMLLLCEADTEKIMTQLQSNESSLHPNAIQRFYWQAQKGTYQRVLRSLMKD